ncbi:B3 domain-containing protein Os06g0112300-like [Triticum dicoccoides]|uniref:B3 domain-containing protein Os06g0112300-like n=1 Tax=Triticum dicoccoides TaxID=85692 RepID=UPI0018915F9B|nr:B3 domain-containing protein Os06g0112300-like [Triticum dicoccoides]
MAAASTEPALPGGSPADEDAEAVVASDDLRHLPDQALQARLQRMQASIHGGIAARLPDDGRTFRRKLLAIRRELERRKGQASALSATDPHTPSPSSLPPPTRQGGPPDGDQCKRIVQSRCMESSDVQGTSSLPDRVKDEQMETPLCPSKQLLDAHPIKPKVEPCENSLSPAPDASEDCETTPLSCNHPFFTVILSRSHVQKPFQLYIPGRFHKHLPEERTSATLICRGRSWAMRYCGDLKTKRLDADWMDFAVDNRLQVSDACVFELVTGTREEVVFQVQILRGGLPKDITSKGYTADEPLVIVG